MTNPTTGFRQHPLRERLHNEVHARPPNALVPPVEICHLAFLSARDNSTTELRHLQRLAASFGVAGPQEDTNHFAADLGPLRVNFERHTEFSRYTFIAKSDGSPPFHTPVLGLLPDGWLAETAGEVIAAVDVALVPGDLPGLSILGGYLTSILRGTPHALPAEVVAYLRREQLAKLGLCATSGSNKDGPGNQGGAPVIAWRRGAAISAVNPFPLEVAPASTRTCWQSIYA